MNSWNRPLSIRFELVHSRICNFDKERGIGVEIKVIERKFYHRVDVATINGMGKPDRTERTYVPKFGMNLFIKPLINRAFDKLRHRYIEWGVNENIAIPWKVE